MMDPTSISKRTARDLADNTKPEFVMNAVPVSKTRQLTSRFALLCSWLFALALWAPAPAQGQQTKLYIVDTSLSYPGFPGNANPFTTHKTNQSNPNR